MKKVFMTGSHGMLGQELERLFRGANYEVVGVDRDTLDITDEARLRDALLNLKPDVIINAAAHNAVDKIESEPDVFEAAKKINCDAVRSLAMIANELGSIFVHYSSDYVFDGTEKAGYREGHATSPVNKYGETKLMEEQAVLDVGGKFYLVRLSKLFGKPAVSEGAKKSFVDTMIWLATEGGKTHLDLVDEEVSSPTYAPDLAEFTLKLVESERPYGIYHGANSGTCTWYELAQKVFELKKISIDTTPVSGDKFPRPAKRPMYSELLNTKINIQRSWQEALAEYLNKE